MTKQDTTHAIGAARAKTMLVTHADVLIAACGP
jgi:hypothetical protein